MTSVTPPDPLVAVVLGSDSDFEAMEGCLEVLHEFHIAHEVRVLSCHRSPDDVRSFALGAAGRGIQVIVAGAGGAAGLPGAIAAHTVLPVVGVPIPTKNLGGLDSLYSTLQMPAGVPVAAMAIGSAGARNAGFFAAMVLALKDPGLRTQLEEHKARLQSEVRSKNERVEERVRERFGAPRG